MRSNLRWFINAVIWLHAASIQRRMSDPVIDKALKKSRVRAPVH